MSPRPGRSGLCISEDTDGRTGKDCEWYWWCHCHGELRFLAAEGGIVVPSTDLKLKEAGSLAKPGPVGRIVRLAFAAVCLVYVRDLVQAAASPIDVDGHIRSVILNGIVFGLFLISYVINIGFSRDWKKWPGVVSAGVFVMIAGATYLGGGNPESLLLARSIWGWEMYLFTHLGSAFLIAGLTGTPGCEMRAFHNLYTRMTGVVTKEHVCPVGPLTPIDQWETQRPWMVQ